MLQAEFLRFFGQNSNSGEQFMWNEIAAGWGMQNAEFANIVFAGPVYRTENTHRTELD
jgi:hypothetical protein